MKSTVLLIDDDQDVLDSYLHLMSIAGLTAKAVIDPTQAMSHINPIGMASCCWICTCLNCMAWNCSSRSKP